ncbi:MAG: hypothetical protein C4523_21115 [Myxococcales bacterium]|nr:MAG: hypothetical protein C4523_21115 [Myxococcales bacterium]
MTTGEGWKRFLGVGLIICVAWIASCSDSGGETSTDGDAEGDDEQGESSDGDESSFVYPACAPLSEQYQFPTPAWEMEGDTPTGVALKPPQNDKAVELLASLHDEWIAEFEALDGFPLVAMWIIALSGEGESVDMEKIKLYRWGESVLEQAEDVSLTAGLGEDPSVLVVGAERPLVPLDKGWKYVLAMYEGAVTGADPLPACNGETAHAAYIEAADALVAAEAGEGLVLALPMTPSRQSLVQKALYSTLIEEPTLEIGSFEDHSGDYASLGEYTPDEDTLASLDEHYFRGHFRTPAYQDTEGKFVVSSATLVPAAQGKTEPGFLLIYPKTGEAPYPLVFFQHGGSMSKLDMFKIAKPYLDQGFAMLGIDLPYHGRRSESGEEGGNPMDMADFDSPLKSRDNFRQASADHLAALTGIEVINAALENAIGAAYRLDPERLFFTGHSMGSLSGTITTGVADLLSGSSLIAGGAPYKLLLSDGLFAFSIPELLNGRPAEETKLLMAMLQALLDGGDPANHELGMEDPTVRPKDVIIWEGIDDIVAINPATDMQALLFGVALAEPANHEVEGMASVALPVTDNFNWQEGGDFGAATRVLRHVVFDVTPPNVHPTILLDPLVHVAAAPCFAARAQGGSCTLTE